ncbi:MAG: PAS domain S-box protein [Bacteroidales bacterium]
MLNQLGLLAIGFAAQLLAIYMLFRKKYSPDNARLYTLAGAGLLVLLAHQVLNAILVFTAYPAGLGLLISLGLNIILSLAMCVVVYRFLRNKRIPPGECDDPSSPEMINRILEGAGNIVWVFDANMKVSYVSPLVTRLLGYTPQEIRGKDLYAFLSAHSASRLRETVSGLKAFVAKSNDASASEMEMEFYSKNGASVWLDVLFRPLKYEKGVLINILGIIRDGFTEGIQENRFRSKYRFGELVAQISQKIISTKIELIDEAIEYTLEQIGKLANVDRCYVSLFDNELNEVSDTHEWCAPGIHTQIADKQNIWLNVFPYFSSEIKKFNTVSVKNLEELPEAASKEKKILSAQGVEAVLMIPMIHEKQLLGILGLESMQGDKEWAPEFILFIKMIGDIVANGLMRKAYVLVLKESEERYKLLSNITFEGIAIHRYGLIIDCNESFLRIFQLSRKEAIGNNPVRAVVDKENYALLEEKMEREMGYFDPINILATRKDGSTVYLETEGKVLNMEEGKYQVVSFRDVTSRIKAENELRKSEAKFRAFNENMKGAVYTFDGKGRFRYVNRALCTISEYPQEELEAMHFWDLLHPEDHDLVKARGLSRVRGENVINVYEFRIITKTGQTKWVEISNSKLEVEDEPMVLGTAIDITERKRAEMAIKEQEATLSSIFRAAPIGIGMVKGRNVVMVNEGLCQMLGYQREELIGKNNRILYVSEEEYQKAGIEDHQDKKNPGMTSAEIRLLRKSGDPLDVLLSKSPLEPENLKKGVIFTAMDITASKKVSRELMESQERYQKLVDQAVDSIYMYDKDLNLVDVNQVACRMLGYKREQLLSGKVTDFDEYLRSHQQEKGFPASILKKKNFEYETFHLRQDGSRFPVEVRITSIHFKGEKYTLAFARDITEYRKAKLIQDVLYNVSMATGHSADLQELFSLIHKELSQLLDTSNLFIALYDKEKDVMELPYMKDKKEVFERFPARDTITSLVLRDKKSYFLKGSDIDELHAKGLIRRYGPEAKVWMGVPLKIEDEPIGVMVLQNYENAQAYDMQDLEIIETIAPQISLSIARKKNEEDLRWNERNLKEAQRVARLGSWEKNIMTGEMFWSDELYHICGVDKEDTTPSDEYWDQILHSADRKKIEKAIETTLRTGKSFKMESRIVLPGNNIRFVLVQGELIKSEKGKPEKIIASVLDITDRIQAENALKDSEKKYRNLAESAPYGIIVHSGYSVEYANHQAVAILEAGNPQQILGRNVLDFVPAKDRDKVTEWIEKLYNGHPSADIIESPFITIDGNRIDVEISATHILFNGKPAAQVIFRDITRQKLDQEQIRKMSSAVDKSPASVTITDRHGVIEYVNPRFTEVTGFAPEEIIGKTHRMLKSGRHSRAFYRDLWETISSGKLWQGEIYNRKKNGEFFWAEESISSLKSNGKITHYVALWQDISERKKMQEELITAKEKAEEMNRVKSNFLATMSHELRTPLNGILGFAEILYNSLDEENLKEMADIINQSGHRLLETLNSILNLSVLESKKLEINRTHVDVRQMIEDVKKLYIPTANKKSIFLATDFKTIDTELYTDGKFLRQVFNNLLNNAIKYTREGGVIIEVDEERIEENTFIVVKFVDTGIGISNENKAVIFEEFRQVSEGYNREFEGTGLGLNICKRYINALDGDIEVESEPGKGSVFTVRLPRVKSPVVKNEEKPRQIKKPRLYQNPVKDKKPAILFVEDEATNRQYVKIILTKLNYAVDLAKDGPEAIKMAGDHAYDIVLMDINLGKDMNGIQAMKRIRQSYDYKDIPFVAVTANAMAGHREEFLSEGFDHYISKPFNMTRLSKLVYDITKKQRT